MAVIDRVGSAIRTLATDIRRDDVVVECRHCGHTRTDEEGPCPTCGQTEIARFAVD
jgi:rubrerythrin